jgi:tetratricopeptide (TPR) repeat protein
LSNSKKQQPKNKSSHARRTAKPAPKSSEQKAVQAKNAKAEQHHEEKKRERQARTKKIAAIFFSVLLILAFAVPSVSVLMGFNSSSSADDEYQAEVDNIQTLIDADSSEPTNYLNMADTYYNWATDVLDGNIDSSHSSDELFQEALSNYSTYLQTENDTDAVINMAFCYYYLGDLDSAQGALVAQTEKDPNNAVLWAKLGQVYQNNGDTENAKTAYNKAISLDEDDSQGAKSFAEQQLSTLD